MVRIVGSYLTAVASAYILAVIFISQGNIASVVEMGFQVTIAQRLDAVFHDLTHMTGIYLPVIAVSMLISLSVAAVIIKFLPNLRLIGYVLAGITGLIAIHIIIKLVFGISGIASTRTLIGLLAQVWRVVLGGICFTDSRQKSNRQPRRFLHPCSHKNGTGDNGSGDSSLCVEEPVKDELE